MEDIPECHEAQNDDKKALRIREVYYLNNWYRYKVNLKELNFAQMNNARLLFKALKELSKEDRDFLAMKYDRPTIPTSRSRAHPSDKIVAAELNMEASEYTKQRRTVQKKLKLIMQKQTDKKKGRQ